MATKTKSKPGRAKRPADGVVAENPIATKSFSDLQFSIPPPSDDAITASLELSRFMHEAFSTYNKERRKTALLIGDMMTEARNKLVSLIGPPVYNRILDYKQQQRLNNYGVKQFRHGTDDHDKLVEAKRKAKDYVKSLLTNAGVKPEKITRINEEVIKKFRPLVRPGIQKKDHAEVVDQSRVPKDVLSGRSNPWTIRTPPYEGTVNINSWTKWGGSDPEFIIYPVAGTGRVGCRSEYENYSASDFSGVDINSYNGIGIWINVQEKPKNTIDIWAKARCDRFQYNIWLDDEFGFSDSDTVTNSYFDLWICPSGTPFNGYEILTVPDIIDGTWWAHVAGSPDDHTSAGVFVSPNTERWIHYKFKFPYKPYAGWWVLWVGMHDIVGSNLNDVSADIRLKDRWFIEEIHYEIE